MYHLIKKKLFAVVSKRLLAFHTDHLISSFFFSSIVIQSTASNAKLSHTCIHF